MAAGLTRVIGLRDAIAVNVITMIGIGPLVTIPLVVAALGGPLALVGWIAGAVVALCDGLVWAELASHFPGSGGTYVYLRNIFGAHGLGRALAFLFNWQFLLYGPCLLASGYIGFANYAAFLYPPLGTNVIAHDAVAVGIGIVTLLVLHRETSHVAAVGSLLAIAATFTIAIVAVAGFSHGHVPNAIHLGAPATLSAGFVAGFGTALYITLYDYVGYSDAALLGDEVVRAQRTIPMAIVLSIVIVAALYIALQLGVLHAIAWQSLLDAHGVPNAQAQYVGSLVVERAWGHAPAVAVTFLVLITAFASLYGNLLGFSRISFAAARDGAFLPAFARLHPRKNIPHVALLVLGILSLGASLFTLDQVIAFLTAGIVLIQGVAQIFALGVLRASQRSRTGPGIFRMPLYPLPAILALAGWTLAFVYTGGRAIALGVGWLGAGTLVFLWLARRRRWWPFALAALLVATLHNADAAQREAGAWGTWQTSRIADDRGYPVFMANGRPFFVYGAAFFYERLNRDQWRSSLLAYKRMGINTIDLYIMWNWHQPNDAPPDFTGASDPRRDLVGLLRMTHAMGFKLIVRPGPVIRNEWRNGGYPAWLLERPEYQMPLRDVLEGRYPATATLQNANADAAAAQWLANPTHRREAARWLRAALGAIAPFAHDVIAIALDDDQGAYLDNDTWPAPNWHAYVSWLASVVRSQVGGRVPLFINTYEMKVTAASPVWAWGDWYASDTYSIGPHDLADIDFATGLLQTQPAFPVMQAEFQGGWLQQADQAVAPASDPSNTTLALAALLRAGAHGIVNFPVQDTVYPDGWEAPWANHSYAWGAALSADLQASTRYAPTAAFGELVRRYGARLAVTHVAADAAIVWPPSMFESKLLDAAAFQRFAGATIAMQRECRARGLSCDLIDLRYADLKTLRRYRAVLLPFSGVDAIDARVAPIALNRLEWLRATHRLATSLAQLEPGAFVRGASGVTLLLADDGSYGFAVIVNPSDAPRRVGPFRIYVARRPITIAALTVPRHDARVIPVDLSTSDRRTPRAMPTSSPIVGRPFVDPDGQTVENARVKIVFAPRAGARIFAASATNGTNAATSIGLLRDAVDPAPTPSSRDYIAAYTHPLPAGTFNRAYACSSDDGGPVERVQCAYDAPDIPDGGARFERRLVLDRRSSELVVDERFEPHGAVTAALESISGFAFGHGDALIESARGDAVGILHGNRLAILRWRADEVRRVDLRATLGAELVTLVFARASVQLRLGVYTVTGAPEARRVLDENWQDSSSPDSALGGSGGMADAAASKAAEATHVGSTPTFPTLF